VSWLSAYRSRIRNDKAEEVHFLGFSLEPSQRNAKSTKCRARARANQLKVVGLLLIHPGRVAEMQSAESDVTRSPQFLFP
jgi:hypothetical protein